ncbi:DUF3618 domain-containing protein [Crossiella cryophila]|uniref:DUF3618 domain-containing protein n=1 Tax=Crossiella cryophila TaxID=43355 RepID=A0A7W7FW00_9PSEU|nr:DUF3618 domain-containing protein [Crossiella cryophila]MBB4677349.1 hypothetical protein [Crossiella cryophila]
MSGTDRVEELQQQVQHTRARLGDTVGELNRRAERKLHRAAEFVPFALGGLALLVVLLLLRKIRG